MSPILAERTANALIADVGGLFPPGLPHARTIAGAVEGFKARAGGLWVGGTARLTAAEFTFSPNEVNRLAHSTGTDIVVPLVGVDAVHVEPAFATKIVVLTVGDHSVKVRCWKAAAFAEDIRAAVEKARERG